MPTNEVKMNVIDVLCERGFIEAMTHEDELKDYINQGNVSCYIGFDPTASSLHVGSLVPIMSLAHMQREGHRPIALVGGGTGLVGDPSGKTEMRQLLTLEMVNENAEGIKKQLERFLDFSNNKAIMVNNADWLTEIKYIPFLRDIGRHFSVNKMIKAESYKVRIDSEEGLNFIEFNYMLLQAYDFMELFNKHDCRIQMGGSDQWGNIVAGIELIRRSVQGSAYGITFPLITTSSGAKMGKTAKGAVWLDPERTSPYDYYQFWVNTDDNDVKRFLSLFTFLPMDEIRKVEGLDGADLNAAKTILAYETTKLAHGDMEASKAYQAAVTMFGKRDVDKNLLPSSTIHKEAAQDEKSSVPVYYIDTERCKVGISFFDLLHESGMTKSKGEARRLISQGGGYINGDRIDSFDYTVTIDDFKDEEVTLRTGKKKYQIVRLK